MALSQKGIEAPVGESYASPTCSIGLFQKGIEAPVGFEPTSGGFADLSLNHLGTAPDWNA